MELNVHWPVEVFHLAVSGLNIIHPVNAIRCLKYRISNRIFLFENVDLVINLTKDVQTQSEDQLVLRTAGGHLSLFKSLPSLLMGF